MTLHLFMLAPEVRFKARVNMASVTYPLDEIVYDTVTVGAEGQVFNGMTVLLGSTDGADDYGRQRVRDNPASNILPVGRSSQGTRDGELDVHDNAYITILTDFRVWAKIPYIDPSTGQVYKDSDIPGDTGWPDTPPPLANGGKGFAGTIDPDTGLITVNFSGTNSVAFDSTVSSSLVSVADYLWGVEDGTITAGSATTSSITATFPAGFRYVHLTVIDDNAIGHQCHIPVFARDPDNDLSIAHQVVGHRATPQGQELQVRILEDIPRDDYPEGTLVMLWDDDQQIAATTRPHMLFIGWEQTSHAGIRAERTANLRDTVINCVDTAGRLKTLPGFSQIMTNGAPSDWQYTKYPNMYYYFWFILYWHSTALEVSDLLLDDSTLNNFEFVTLSSDESSLFDQIESLANAVTPDQHLTCNKANQLILVTDPIVQYAPDRQTTVAADLGEDDWYEIRFGRLRPPRVAELITWAILSSDTTVTVVRCRAPGSTPGQGYQRIESTGDRITDLEFQFYATEGNRYARMNAPYGRFEISVPFSKLPPAFDLARYHWVRLTITGNNIPYGMSGFTLQRGIVHELSIQYDYVRTGLVRTAHLSWELETSGFPAIDYPPPEEE